MSIVVIIRHGRWNENENIFRAKYEWRMMEMLLPECLIKAIGRTIGGIYLYCRDEDRDDIRSYIFVEFVVKWDSTAIDTERKYGSCFERDHGIEPIAIRNIEGGIYIEIRRLYQTYTDKECLAICGFEIILSDILEDIAANYPLISYLGYVGYVPDRAMGYVSAWEDQSSVIQQEWLFSENDVSEDIYPFVGTALADAITEDKMLFWHMKNQIGMSPLEYETVLQMLWQYKKWIGTAGITNMLNISKSYWFSEDEWQEIQLVAMEWRAKLNGSG